MAMTDGISLPVTTVAAILVAVLMLAVLSSLVFLRMDAPSGRRSLVLFWACLAATWLLAVAVIAAVAMMST